MIYVYKQRFERFALLFLMALLIVHAFSCQVPRRRSSKKAGLEVVGACCILECDCCSIRKLFDVAMMLHILCSSRTSSPLHCKRLCLD